MTRGEQLVLDDANDFVRQATEQLEDQDQSTGIRPYPVIEASETTLDTTRFGMQFGPKPLSEAEPGSEAPPPEEPTGACCVDEFCSITTEAHCAELEGVYQGDGTSCSPDPCACVCPSDFANVNVEFSGIVGCGCTDLGEEESDGSFLSSISVDGFYSCVPDGVISGVWRYIFPNPTVIGSYTSYDKTGCLCNDPPPDPPDCPTVTNVYGIDIVVECNDGIWTIFINASFDPDAPAGFLSCFGATDVCLVNHSEVANQQDCGPYVGGTIIAHGGTATITF